MSTLIGAMGLSEPKLGILDILDSIHPNTGLFHFCSLQILVDVGLYALSKNWARHACYAPFKGEHCDKGGDFGVPHCPVCRSTHQRFGKAWQLPEALMFQEHQKPYILSVEIIIMSSCRKYSTSLINSYNKYNIWSL
jgi:hypothetical protein